MGALCEHIPEAEFVVPEGGYFLWLTLEDDVDTLELLQAAARGRVVRRRTGLPVEGGPNALRLSFASVPAERVPEGVARIAKALEGIRASRAAA